MDGRSHSPDEFADTEDIALGAAVLLEAVMRLDQTLQKETLMMGRILTEKDVEPAVKGGSVYAAGGGGWADHGRMLGYAAVNVGKPELVEHRRAWPITTGWRPPPPSAPRPPPRPGKCRASTTSRPSQLLQETLGEKLAGLIIGQNGKSSTLNGWLPSAMLGTKVVDAVGDIRAHPTGDMGRSGWPLRPSR